MGCFALNECRGYGYNVWGKATRTGKTTAMGLSGVAKGSAGLYRIRREEMNENACSKPTKKHVSGTMQYTPVDN